MAGTRGAWALQGRPLLDAMRRGTGNQVAMPYACWTGWAYPSQPVCASACVGGDRGARGHMFSDATTGCIQGSPVQV